MQNIGKSKINQIHGNIKKNSKNDIINNNEHNNKHCKVVL